MKKLNFTSCIFLLLLPIISMAQGWERTYDGGLDEWVSAADRTPDGGIIISGTQRNTNNGIDIPYLYKTDSHGNLEWEWYDSTHSATLVNSLDVLSTSDGNYLHSILYGNNLPINTYIIQKLSPSGNVLWDNNQSTFSELIYVTDLAETDNGDYLLLGRAESPSGNTSVGLARMSDDGTLIWEYNVAGDDDTPAFPGEVMEAANGDILIVGYEGFANIDQIQFVKRFSENGTLLWEQNYSSGIPNFGLELLEISNGDILVAGSSAQDINVQYATLLKIDANGNEIWNHVYTSLGQQVLKGFEQTSDGGFVLSGFIPIGNNATTDLYLLKVDNDGNEVWTKTYGRSKNDQCVDVFNADDNGFYLVGQIEKIDDSIDAYLIKTDSLGNSLTNLLSGTLYYDEDENCTFDSALEEGQPTWLITATQGNQEFLTLTNESGYFELALDTGTYNIETFPISTYWGVCNNNFTVNFTNYFETISEDIGAQAILDCPLLDISIGTPFLRRCFENTYHVQYCNYGTAIAEDAQATILLDPDMIFISSSIISTQSEDTLFFELGDVAVGECGTFSFDVQLGDENTCDSIPLGASHCVEAHIFPDSICVPVDDWSGASIEVDAFCQGDSILFQIQNTGTAPTQSNLEYLVIEDDVILYQGTVSLGAGAIEIIVVETSGSTYFLTVEQEPNHPGFSMPGISVEGCGEENAIFTFGFVNIFPQDDANSFVDIDCRQNIGAYDPNDKTGFPLGYGTSNYIDQGQDIEYLIRFQNTGTDTAFNVVIRDTLSPLLDVTSVRPGASSHDYSFDITNGNVLTFNFNNIMLPDSNVNEPASNGFVKFKIAQIPELPLESEIYNSAAIYFDFNAPIITNQTLHTIGEDYIIVSIESPDPGSLADIKAYPNPMSQSARIEIESVLVDEGVFEVYDALGRLVKRQEFNGNRFDFQRGNLQSGLYFYTIYSKQSRIATGKLTVQ